MGLGLHPQCLSRLSQSVAEHLPEVRVDHGRFLNYSGLAPLFAMEKTLPRSKTLMDSLRCYVGEYSLYTFVSESISRDIFETNQYSAKQEGVPLVSYANYSIPADAAKRLVDDYNTLPWTFIVSLRIPNALGSIFRNTVGNLSLSDSFRLVCPDDQYSQSLPLKSGIEQRDEFLFHGGLWSAIAGESDEEARWNQETAYLQTVVKGFIDPFAKTAPFQEAIAQFKSFLGLAVAVRLLKVKKDTPRRFGAPSSMGFRVLVHRDMTSYKVIWSRSKLPPELSGFLDRLEIEDFAAELGPAYEGSTLPSASIKEDLSSISTAFKKPDQAARILLAAQWLVDSYTGTNDLLSYVQAAVAMEILLGEEEKTDIIGIGELLRNRCAYLIGTSRSQREGVLTDFKRIYDVRSRIVHRGKTDLTLEERMLFQKLRWMCGRVIQEELRLISKDNAQPLASLLKAPIRPA